MKFVENDHFLGVGVAALCIALASCAPKEPKEAQPAVEPNESAAANITTAAAASDLPSATKVDCSAVKPQAAPTGSPTDDILGVRQGMQPVNVKAVLACHDKNFIIREDEVEYNFGEEKIPGLKITADNGLDRVIVQFMRASDGPDGYQLVKISRRVEYAEGKGYAVDVLKSTLENKYGAFVEKPSYHSNASIGALVYTADGQALGASNSAFNSCTDENANRAADISVNEKCAIVVGYNLEAMRDDEKQAHALVTMVAYPRLAFSGKLAAMDAMKAAADARSAEVKSIAGAGKGPAL